MKMAAIPVHLAALLSVAAALDMTVSSSGATGATLAEEEEDGDDVFGVRMDPDLDAYESVRFLPTVGARATSLAQMELASKAELEARRDPPPDAIDTAKYDMLPPDTWSENNVDSRVLNYDLLEPDCAAEKDHTQRKCLDDDTGMPIVSPRPGKDKQLAQGNRRHIAVVQLTSKSNARKVTVATLHAMTHSRTPKDSIGKNSGSGRDFGLSDPRSHELNLANKLLGHICDKSEAPGAVIVGGDLNIEREAVGVLLSGTKFQQEDLLINSEPLGTTAKVVLQDGKNFHLSQIPLEEGEREEIINRLTTTTDRNGAYGQLDYLFVGGTMVNGTQASGEGAVNSFAVTGGSPLRLVVKNRDGDFDSTQVTFKSGNDEESAPIIGSNLPTQTESDHWWLDTTVELKDLRSDTPNENGIVNAGNHHSFVVRTYNLLKEDLISNFLARTMDVPEEVCRELIAGGIDLPKNEKGVYGWKSAIAKEYRGWHSNLKQMIPVDGNKIYIRRLTGAKTLIPHREDIQGAIWDDEKQRDLICPKRWYESKEQWAERLVITATTIGCNTPDQAVLTGKVAGRDAECRNGCPCGEDSKLRVHYEHGGITTTEIVNCADFQVSSSSSDSSSSSSSDSSSSGSVSGRPAVDEGETSVKFRTALGVLQDYFTNVLGVENAATHATTLWDGIKAKDRPFSTRGPKLLLNLIKDDPSVLLLQEYDMYSLNLKVEGDLKAQLLARQIPAPSSGWAEEYTFHQFLELFGYQGTVFAAPKKKDDGVGIYWKTDQFAGPALGARPIPVTAPVLRELPESEEDAPQPAAEAGAAE